MTKQEFKEIVELATGHTLCFENGNTGYKIALNSVDALLFVNAFNEKFGTDHKLGDSCNYKSEAMLAEPRVTFGIRHYVRVVVPFPQS